MCWNPPFNFIYGADGYSKFIEVLGGDGANDFGGKSGQDARNCLKWDVLVCWENNPAG